METLSHLFCDCPWTKEFWKLSNFAIPNPMLNSFRDVIDWVWHHNGKHEVGKFVTLCWQIWESRNDDVFNQVHLHPLLGSHKLSIWLLLLLIDLTRSGFDLLEILLRLILMGHTTKSRIRVELVSLPEIAMDFSVLLDRRRYGLVGQLKNLRLTPYIGPCLLLLIKVGSTSL